VLSASALVIAGLVGCTPAPEPEPTKTELFASDEEAFAAAEETYRAYMDASNATDLSDAQTFEAVYDWNTGSALSAEKEALTLYHAEKLRRVGEGSFDNFEPTSATDDEVIVHLCIDVSDVDLVRADGQSAIPGGREPRVARKVTFVPGP